MLTHADVCSRMLTYADVLDVCSISDGGVKPRAVAQIQKMPEYAFGEYGGRYIPGNSSTTLS